MLLASWGPWSVALRSVRVAVCLKQVADFCGLQIDGGSGVGDGDPDCARWRNLRRGEREQVECRCGVVPGYGRFSSGDV